MKWDFLKVLVLITFATNCFLVIKDLLGSYYSCKSNEIRTLDAKLGPNITANQETIPKPQDLLDLKDFEYIISKPPCNRHSNFPSFVILVYSSPSNFERRMTIRQTWASKNITLTYFLLGAVPCQSFQKFIEAEDKQYHDIIQGNFMDTYHNLTYKHTMLLKWFTENCLHVKHLVKLDDDVFVNVPAVHQFLQNYKHKPKFLMGRYRTPGLCARNDTNKWKITYEQRRESWFPEFVTGPTIVYSNEYAITAYKATATTPFFWLEDVLFTGFIRMQLNVKITPIQRYLLDYKNLENYLNGIRVKAPNADFLFSDHYMNDNQLYSIWNFTENLHLND